MNLATTTTMKMMMPSLKMLFPTLMSLYVSTQLFFLNSIFVLFSSLLQIFFADRFNALRERSPEAYALLTQQVNADAGQCETLSSILAEADHRRQVKRTPRSLLPSFPNPHFLRLCRVRRTRPDRLPIQSRCSFEYVLWREQSLSAIESF